ncbi:GNAT family N-acetyltransferase [Novosphingobium aquimarinum]|uniref:GNAT family N-acetyltransferase n=1 Tax=Novosphingobium aquimarinum TaxID=2682494 RepID=UPI0012ECAB41|nr:GNAT family N-acetyltransferase [Novosphingobium aquimarinum]
MTDPVASPPLVTLHPATGDQLRDVADLLNRAYRQPGWNSEAELLGGQRADEAMLRDDLANTPLGHLLIWQPDPTAPPMACVWLADEGRGTWYLGSLAVDTAAQSGGVGGQVLDAAEAYVRGHGGTRIRMQVIDVRDTLIAWYERRGFARTGTSAPFPYGDARFGMPRRDDLAFVELAKRLG